MFPSLFSIQSSSCQHVFYFRLRSEVYFQKWLPSYKNLSANLNSCGVTGGTPRARYAVTKAEPKSNCLSTWALPGGPPHATLHVPLALALPNVIPNLQGETPPPPTTPPPPETPPPPLHLHVPLTLPHQLHHHQDHPNHLNHHKPKPLPYPY